MIGRKPVLHLDPHPTLSLEGHKRLDKKRSFPGSLGFGEVVGDLRPLGQGKEQVRTWCDRQGQFTVQVLRLTPGAAAAQRADIPRGKGLRPP